MALDPSIILQGQAPKFDDPLTVRAKQAQLSDLMTQGQARQMQLQQAQQAAQQEQTLADLYRTHGTDSTALVQGMAKSGLGGRIPGYQKQQAEVGKVMTESEAAKYKLLKEQITDTSAGLQSLLSDPQLSTDKVVNWLAQRAAMMPDQAQRLAQEAAQLPGDPGRLRQKLMEKALEAQDATKRLDLILGKTEMVDQGGARQAFTTSQLTGQVTPGQSFAKTATPEAILTDQRTRSEGALNRGVTMRGQDIGERTAAAAREAAKEKVISKETKVKDAEEAIQLINQAEPLLKGSTGSYGGMAIDKVAQFFGSATPGAVNAQQLKAIEGALVSKMPKMSGPQSDKDVALYRQMAAVIGDETIPYAQKAAALQEVRAIQERYAGMVPGSSKPSGKPAKPAAPAGVVDWDAL